MAKATMRPEVKAQKLKNNKTSHLPLKCSTPKCDNDSQIITGPFANRIRTCDLVAQIRHRVGVIKRLCNYSNN